MRQKPLTTPYIGNRALEPPRRYPPRMKALEAEEAVQAILDLISPPENENLKVKFYAKKLVSDILDYCNRGDDDFPMALIFTCVELINKRLDAEKVDELTGSTLPVKRIKQGDSEIEFAVAEVSTVGLMADEDFNSIKTKLNLYRRIRSW